MADIKELQLPLADVLIETGRGIVAMNDALGPNNVGARIRLHEAHR